MTDGESGMIIKRYYIGKANPMPKHNGDWIRYKDYYKDVKGLKQEIERLKNELELQLEYNTRRK
jgi:hypothetical protein